MVNVEPKRLFCARPEEGNALRLGVVRAQPEQSPKNMFTSAHAAAERHEAQVQTGETLHVKAEQTHKTTLVHRRAGRISADERLHKRSEYQTFRLQKLNFHRHRLLTFSRKPPSCAPTAVELELFERLFAKKSESRALCGGDTRAQDFYREQGLCVVNIVVKVRRAARRSRAQIVSRKTTFARCRLCFCAKVCGPPSQHPDPANPWQTGRYRRLSPCKSPGRRIARAESKTFPQVSAKLNFKLPRLFAENPRKNEYARIDEEDPTGARQVSQDARVGTSRTGGIECCPAHRSTAGSHVGRRLVPELLEHYARPCVQQDA